MLEEIASKLAAIDPVLNEQQLQQAIERDHGKYDPVHTYSPTQARGLDIFSLPAYRSTGKEGRYLLFQMNVSNHDAQKTLYWLRGFDFVMDTHPLIAWQFLTQELRKLFPEFPRLWPQVNYWQYRPSLQQHIDDVTLSLTPAGGLFTVRSNNLHLYGESIGFGGVPSELQPALHQLVEQLVQRDPLKGLKPKYTKPE